MVTIRNILAATDFSANAANAEARGAFLCRELALDRFHLLNVHGTAADEILGLGWTDAVTDVHDAYAMQAQLNLERAQERVRSRCGIDCHYAARAGDVVSEILNFADANMVDLIAVGDSSRNCVEKLLGTTAFRLIRRASRPVLLARIAPTQRYQNVLVPIDFSDPSKHAARLALEIAPQAHVTFLHVYSVWAEGKMKLAGVDQDIINGYRGRYGMRARAALNRFIEELDCGPRLVSRVVKAGIPVPVITAHAEKIEPDLIVLGNQGGSRAEAYLMGNMTHRVINDTRCDVLVTPGVGPGKDYFDLRPAA